MSISSRISSMEEHVTNAYNGLQGLGADLTNVNKNIENISMVLDNIYDDLPKVTGSGTSITLDDTRVGKIKSTLKGNTSQDGTPTPSSPIPINVVSGDNSVVVCGKNLFDKSRLISGKRLDSSGEPSINTEDYVTTDYFIAVEPSTTYYSTALFNQSKCVCLYDSSYNHIERLFNLNSRTFTTTSSTKFVKISILSSEVDTEQLEVGSSETTYEPYQSNTYNIDLPEGMELCKIGNYQDYFGKSDGRNLFDKSSIEEGKRLGSDGLPFDDTSFDLSDYIKVDSNTQYTYSRGSNGSGSSAIAYYDSSKTFISRTMPIMDSNAREVVLTTPNNATYVRIADLKTTLDSMQLEKGSSASDYQPYGVGKWYLHKEIGKVVLNGSETWKQDSLPSGLSYYSFYTNVVTNRIVKECPLFSNKLINNNNVYTTDTQGITCNWQGNLRLKILDSSLNTETAFKTWLSSNNIMVYYELETPTSTQITYQPLISQLNTIEKAMSKDGQTNISQVNNDLPFIISASALKEWQESTSLNSTLSMVNPLSLGNTLNTQENDIQPIEVDNIEPLEEEENEES